MKKINYLLVAIVLLFTACKCDTATKNPEQPQTPKNVIFMIGDGMGLAQVYAGMIANGNKLNLERSQYIGISKTYSFDDYTTDSAAGGTALACGVKTKNGMIGMNPDSVAVNSILKVAENNGLATGIVVTCDVTHATPAAFIANQINRKMEEEIAADFLKTDIDVFIGGGRKNFENRKDGVNLTEKLRENNYNIAYTIDEVKAVKSGKLAALLYDEHPPIASERGKMSPDAVMTAIDILKNNDKGFFLMIEGSQIDWAGHANDYDYLISEMLDFDETIGRVFDWAEKDGNTLVVITADHETGGLSMPSGNIADKISNTSFSTKQHSGIPVPVYAFGPGAENFKGFMENIELKEKIENTLNIK